MGYTNKFRLASVAQLIAFIILIAGTAAAVSNGGCSGWASDLPSGWEISPWDPANCESCSPNPTGCDNYCTESSCDCLTEETEIPPEECYARAVDKDSGSELWNSGALSNCEGGARVSSISKTNPDIDCTMERTVVVQGVFHNNQVCTDKEFDIRWDDQEYWCEQCMFAGIGSEEQSGVWSPDTSPNSCCGDDIDGGTDPERGDEDDPDAAQTFCINCMAGDDRPNEPYGINPRMWDEGGGNCCGDDYPDGIFMLNGKRMCWPSDLTYSSKFSSLIYDGSTSHMNGPFDGKQWFWTDPEDIPYKVIQVKPGADGGMTDNIEFLPYSGDWHVCWPGSFSQVTGAGPFQEMSLLNGINPVFPGNAPTSFLCSNTAYSSSGAGAGISRIDPPAVYECGERVIRDFDGEIIGGITIPAERKHYYSLYNEITREYIPNRFVVPRQSGSEIPSFGSISAMEYVEDTGGKVCNDCMIIIADSKVWRYDGDEITSRKLGDPFFAGKEGEVSIKDIEALSYISHSFGVNGKYVGVAALDGTGGTSMRFFRTTGESEIEESDTSSSLKSLLPGCSDVPANQFPNPNEVTSMYMLTPPDNGAAYPLLIVFTAANKYLIEDSDIAGCHVKIKPNDGQINYEQNMDKVSSGGELRPEAITYIPPDMADEFNLPVYTGTILAYNQNNLLYALMAPPIYCTPSRWSTNLDGSGDYEETCSAFASENNEHEWTGSQCCGEGEDAFETYRDPDADDADDYPFGVCFKGRAYRTGENLIDPDINREPAGVPNILRETLVVNTKVYSCAIDHRRTCEMQDGYAENYGECDMNRMENKPYQGTSNLLRAATTWDTGDNMAWNVTNGRRYGSIPSSGFTTTACRTADGCFRLEFSDDPAELPAAVYQKVYNTEPETEYHLSVYMVYRGDYKDRQNISLKYEIIDRQTGEEAWSSSKEFTLTGSWENYIQVFTTPEEPYFDYNAYEHRVVFQADTANHSTHEHITFDDARLASNDYLLDIKNYEDPFNRKDYDSQSGFLGDDYGIDMLFYCQTLNTDINSDPLPDVYCGYDERFHDIEELFDGGSNSSDFDEFRDRAYTDLRLKYINWSPEWNLVPESVRNAGCCMRDQCWAGEKDGCVDPAETAWDFKLYPNASAKYEALPGYACMLDEDGVARWVNVSPKWYWDNSLHGYCPKESQCLLDRNGNISLNGHPELFSKYEREFPATPRKNPACIDSGQFVLDHYCDNGEWKTRTKIIADTLMGYPAPEESFSLYCGPHERAFNVFGFDIHKVFTFAPENSYCTGLAGDGFPEDRNVSDTYFRNRFILDDGSPDESCIIRECLYRPHDGAQFSEYSKPCINDVCILHTADDQSIIGFSINSEADLSGPHYPISNLFGYRASQSFCQNVVDGGEDSFSRCQPYNDYHVYYNPVKKIVIFSKGEISPEDPDSFTSGPGISVEGIASIMREHFWSVQNPMEPVISFPNELNFSGNYSNFFYTQHLDGALKRVYGTVTESAGRPASTYRNKFNGRREDLFVGFEGFGLPICESFDNATPPDRHYCNATVEQVRIAYQDDAGREDSYYNLYWPDLTAKLRLFRR